MQGKSYAYAIANNTVCYVRWHFEARIPGCLGFSIHRLAVSQTGERLNWEGPLAATVSFSPSSGPERMGANTDVWPVQKFEWRDTSPPPLAAFRYRIIPMLGVAGDLRADETQSLETNAVSLTQDFGPLHVFFLRGIVGTLPGDKPMESKEGRGTPRGKLHGHIESANDPLRELLSAGSLHSIRSFLARASHGGRILAALHELNDEVLVEELRRLGNKVELILTNADSNEEFIDERGRKKTRRVPDKINDKLRRNLTRHSQVILTNRFLEKSAVGHNKFLIHVDERGVPRAVLSGSTEWTSFSLCAQTNNILVIESPEIAVQFYDCWHRLKKDDGKLPNGSHPNKQALDTSQQPMLRTENARPPLPVPLGGGELKAWFSPNTKLKVTPSGNLHTPPDMAEVLSLISNAQKSILFLMFKPAAPSIAQHIRELHRERLKASRPIYVAGVATDPTAEGQFVEVFLRGASHMLQGPARARISSVEPINDEFNRWETEMFRLGHPVIHDNFVVIDHWDTQSCVVITGSHNLNYRASCCNDENLMIIKGVRNVALAYAAHVMDVSDHFRWRWCLQQDAKKPLRRRGSVWSGLSLTDEWQGKYFDPAHPAFHDAELLRGSLCSDSSRT